MWVDGAVILETTTCIAFHYRFAEAGAHSQLRRLRAYVLCAKALVFYGKVDPYVYLTPRRFRWDYSLLDLVAFAVARS